MQYALHATLHMPFGKRISIDRNKTFVRRALNVAQRYSGGHFHILSFNVSSFTRKIPLLGAVYMILLCRDATGRDSDCDVLHDNKSMRNK